MIGHQKSLGSIAEFALKIVKILNLLQSGEVLLQVLLIGSNNGQSVTDLVDKITKNDDSKKLDDDDNDDFCLIFRGDISVSDGENGGAAKIEGIKVFSHKILMVCVDGMYPIGSSVIEGS